MGQEGARARVAQHIILRQPAGHLRHAPYKVQNFYARFSSMQFHMGSQLATCAAYTIIRYISNFFPFHPTHTQ